MRIATNDGGSRKLKHDGRVENGNGGAGTGMFRDGITIDDVCLLTNVTLTPRINVS